MSYQAERFLSAKSPRWGRLLAGGIGLLLMVCAGSAAAAPTIDGQVDAEYGPALATDPAGDYVGSAQWDLHTLHVTHDASYLYVAITIAGDLSANPGDEKNYIFYVDTTNDAAGATSDAWLRNISTAAPHRPEYSINSWYKTGTYGVANVELRRWTGSAWDTTIAQIAGAALKVSGGQTVLEWKVARAALGNPSQIWVEAISTGSFQTDNAQDTINAPANDWNAPSGATQWTAASTVQCSTHYVLVPPPDAGVPDVGTPDAGVPDAGKPDVGKPDAGKPDAKLADSAVTPDTRKPDLGAVDQATPADQAIKADADKPADGGRADGSGWPDARPTAGDGGPSSDDGCGCAARGDLTAAHALPLVLSLLFLGFPRRRR